MAAADHSLFTDGQKGVWEEFRRATRERKLPNAKPLGSYFLKVVVPTTTASIDETDDRGLCLYVPGNEPIYLLDFQVSLTDIDTNATPTFVADWVVTDLSTDTVIINDSTAGQTAARDRMDPDSSAFGMDIKGKYIGFKTVTGAATAATGTATLYLVVSAGDVISLD